MPHCDAKGNVTEKDSVSTAEKWTYAYNNANELTEAKHYNASSTLVLTADYKYDIFGNRVEKDVTTTGTATTRYAYDMWNPAKAGAMGTSGSDIWAVLNGSSSLTSRELQGDGIDEHLAYTTSGSNAFWFLSDHLGSIRTVVDSTGAAVHAYSYDAFGNVTSVATPSMYAWTGRELDAETGLQYNRARYYDAATGRWISLDPMGFDAGDSNLYRYVANLPSRGLDPSGLEQAESTAETSVRSSRYAFGQSFILNATPLDVGFSFRSSVVYKKENGQTSAILSKLQLKADASYNIGPSVEVRVGDIGVSFRAGITFKAEGEFEVSSSQEIKNGNVIKFEREGTVKITASVSSGVVAQVVDGPLVLFRRELAVVGSLSYTVSAKVTFEVNEASPPNTVNPDIVPSREAYRSGRVALRFSADGPILGPREREWELYPTLERPPLLIQLRARRAGVYRRGRF